MPQPPRFPIGLFVAVLVAPLPARGDDALSSGLTEAQTTHTSAVRQSYTTTSPWRLVPLISPEQRGGVAQSFEALALLLPGTHEDQYGISFLGSSSPENTFYVDGVRVGDPVFGVLRLPLSMQFVDRADLRGASFDPTFGRGTGGLYDVTTRSGGNRWHISAWSNAAPGVLEGTRTPNIFANQVIETQSRLAYAADIGISAGGPILPDRLFFFAGFQAATRRYRLDRSVYRLNQDPSGSGPEIDPRTGLQTKARLPGMDSTALVDARTDQWLGKLSFRPSATRELSLSILGSRTTSGGDGTYAFNMYDDRIDVTNLTGSYSALGHANAHLTNAVILRGSALFHGGSTRFDGTLGWVFGQNEQAAADGSGVNDIGRPGTWAHIPTVRWRKNHYATGRHAITDFEVLTPEAAALCMPNGDPTEVNIYCPVSTYRTGGPGFLSKLATHRIEGRAVLSTRFSAMGDHRFRAGVDFDLAFASSTRGISGAVRLVENPSGTTVRNEINGFLIGPDELVVQNSLTTEGMSFTAGAFVADTWSIRKNLVAELGLRYDAQIIRAGEYDAALVLPDMISPRAGLSWDPTNKGYVRLHANYALRYQSIPLDLALRGLALEPSVWHHRRMDTCDLAQPELLYGGCGNDPPLTVGETTSPTQRFQVFDVPTTVDPLVRAPASHQLTVGVDFSLPADVEARAAYVHEELIRALEDVLLGKNALVLGNPGFGLAKEAPEATRFYDGFSLSVMRPFANGFLALANYNLSWLRGNYAGLFQPETGQIDPNINTDFDTPMQNINRYRTLAGDQRHAFKIYAGKEIALPKEITIEVGGGYSARSGLPIQALGTDGSLRYGSGSVYLDVPNREFRTPWQHRLDMRLGLSARLRKDLRLGVSMDIFNVTNAQAATSVDQTYTYDSVLINANGTIRYPRDTSVNPNFGKPTAYQPPRQVRFGLHVDY